jgi:threonine dehydrogenase-like Zn-dependent dehydrogenase
MKKAGLDRLAALYTAIETVRRGGTVSLSGVYGGMADPMPMMSLFDKQIQLRMGQANVKRWIPDIIALSHRGMTRWAWTNSLLIGCRLPTLRRRTRCSRARPTAQSRSCSSRGADPTVIIRNLF